MATTATPWIGEGDDKLYLQSGQFSATIKTSLSIGGVDTSPQDISWDGTNTPWCGNAANKLYLQSGQFSSTLKTSRSTNAFDFTPTGISWDGTDTPWCGSSDDKLYLQSGQFSSTLKTSLSVNSIEATPSGVSYDGTNTPWCGLVGDKLYLQSGQFSATMKTSQSVSPPSNPVGLSWDGTNTPWGHFTNGKLYLQSGQFTATLKTSQDVSSVDSSVRGICTDDVDSRLGVGGPTAQALAATVIAVVAIVRFLSAFRTLAAINTGVATIVALAIGLIEQALSATATGITNLAARAFYPRSLEASATGMATLNRLLSLTRTLSVTAANTAVIDPLASFFRTLAATAIGVAVLSRGKIFLQALSATVAAIIGIGRAHTPFPIVLGRTSSVEGSNTTSHSIDLPSGVQVGEHLLVLIVVDNAPAITMPAGWTEIYQAASTFSALNYGIFRKTADGSEGASVTATTGTAQESAHLSYRITGPINPDDQEYEVSTVVESDDGNPNCANLTPTGGAKNYLWLATQVHLTNATTDAFPAGYSNGNSTESGGGDPVSIGAAERQLNAASEDSGAFTLSAAVTWNAVQIAIHPLGVGVLTQALAALATGIAAIDRTVRLSQVLAAIVTGIAQITRIGLFARTLAATATGVATFIIGGILSLVTLAATVTAVAVIDPIITLSRTLAATVVGSPVIAFTTSRFRLLAATIAGSAAVAFAISRSRLLAATAIGVAAISFTKNLNLITLAATASLVAAITALYRPFVSPFTGHGGLGILDGVTRWRSRRRTWRSRR